MKFTELRKSMQSFTGTPIPDYQYSYLSTEIKDFINELNYEFVEYLTKDIIGDNFQLNIKQWLGKNYYNSSNEYAKECIELCPKVNHIWGRKIKSWTDNALKCYDNFLLKYVQEDKNEKIHKSHSRIKETDVYIHLINNKGIEQKIGENFKYVYQIRNKFHHVQIEIIDGKRVPKRISNSKYNEYRDFIIQKFRESLNILLSIIENNND